MKQMHCPDVEIFNEPCENRLPKLKHGEVDLIVTSPPYNLGKEYETAQSLDEYLFFHEKIIRELCRVLRLGGSLCYQVGNFIDKGEVYPLDIHFYEILKRLGLKLRNRIVWTFGSGHHAKHRLSGRHETVLWFTKGDEYVFNLDDVRVPQKYPNKRAYRGKNKGELSCNPLGKNPGDVWDISNIKHGSSEKTEHPCQFPEKLTDRLILAFSNRGETVLDPFLGSGTTIISALRHERKCIGIERERKYVDISEKRIMDFVRNQQSDLF